MKTQFFKKNKLPPLGGGLGWGLLLFLCPVALSAQNGVTVTNLVLDAGTVTFDVSWNKNTMPVEVWSDSVWVFVDYNNNGKMERLPLLPGATLTATSAPGSAAVIQYSGNNKGVWVVGNARTAGTFSATVRAGFKPALTGGACVYASNYPPVAEYTSPTQLVFTGTPPYDIVLKHTGGGTVVTQSGSNFYVPASYTVESFTDKTGAPGTFTCILPTISAHPTVSTSICSGGTVSLSVTASSAATYQWKKNGNNITNEGTGYTSANYTTAALGANATYSVVVSNGLSACSATSSDALVTVHAIPTINTHPASTSACSATTVQLGVTASSAATYQWKKNGVDVSDGTGGTSATYTTAALGANATYSVVVSNGLSACSVTSSSALVTVYAIPTINTQPVSTSACSATTVQLGVTATNATAYQWKKNGVDITSGGSDYTSANYTTAALGANATYSVVVSNGLSACSATSSDALVTVYAKPNINTHPTASTSACSATTVQLEVTATNANLYQWRKDGVDVTDGTGGTSATYTTAALNANATYSVVVSNGLSACSATSNNALVTVYAKPAISAHPAATSTCSGNTVQLSVTATNATAYQWKKNGNNVTDGSGGTTANYTTAALSANATYTVVVSNTLSACSTTSNSAVVSVATCCHASGATVTFAAFNPCSSAATGDYWYLTDTRESGNKQTYKVKKLADGHIWMVQELKFGDRCDKTTFSGSSSDQTGKITSLTDTYYGDCRNTTQSGAGYLYDWAGAIQKSGAYYGSSSNVGCSGVAAGVDGTNPGACRGICPVGWHLPTGASAGEFQALHSAIGGCSTSNGDCWDSSSAWEGVLGGYCTSSGGLYSLGSNANYWSSTYDSSTHAYRLYFHSSNVDPGTINGYKFDGRSVRCVRNY
ncbi:MAG: hypothetical protein LBG45_09010 [Dysgonamonadaceae bacterium]|jgi:uncharacterized protein (TIGR02145 family)|nr:hypothetical protein [Dysgonamonadaceae bacterium]